MAKRKISHEELQDMVEDHQRWLDTNVYGDKRDDFESAVRRATASLGQDLISEGKRDDFESAVRRATASLGQDLISEGKRTRSIGARWPQAEALEARISQLEEQLRKAETDSEKSEALNAQLQEAQVQYQAILKKNEELQAQLDKELSKGVDAAIKALKGSLEQTKNDINSYQYTSNWLMGLGVFGVLVGLAATPLMWWAFPLPATPQWFDYLARFAPAAACFLAATTVLRHDAKLRQRYEHLSIQQHRVELAGGLLQAATELSKVEDWQNLKPIPETFSHIMRQTLGPDPKRTQEGEPDGDFASAVAKEMMAAARKGVGS